MSKVLSDALRETKADQFVNENKDLYFVREIANLRDLEQQQFDKDRLARLALAFEFEGISQYIDVYNSGKEPISGVNEEREEGYRAPCLFQPRRILLRRICVGDH